MTSTAHLLFIDPSEDPFLDPYIETITHMNTKDILAIPKMNDSDFLQYLLEDNHDRPARGKCTVYIIMFLRELVSLCLVIFEYLRYILIKSFV
jgi:hypothetical protein